MGVIFSTKCPDRIYPSCDGFRDTPLRLLGYGTHVGHACSAILPPNIANIPHMVTTAYMFGDVFEKALKSSEAGESRKQVAVAATDALLWQLLASVVIPGLIVDRIKHFTVEATRYKPNSCTPPPPLVKALPPTIVRALPCIFGVLALPIIMYPIDKLVTILMDVTFRPIFKEEDPMEQEKKNKPAKPKKEVKQQEVKKEEPKEEKKEEKQAA